MADFDILANLSTIWHFFEISFETLKETNVINSVLFIGNKLLGAEYLSKSLSSRSF